MNYRACLAVGALLLAIASLGMAAEKEDHKALEKEFAKKLTRRDPGRAVHGRRA